jgi:PPOX class probable F420-dependent enzyme
LTGTEQATVVLEPAISHLLNAGNLAIVSTIEESGGSQQSVVWITERDGQLMFSTLAGRAKHRNLLRDPRISLLVLDRKDAYRYAVISGVAMFNEDRPQELINELSLRYDGKPWIATEDGNRLNVVVRPTRVYQYGLA